MKKFITIALLLFPLAAAAQFDLGFDFRSTSGFVADPSYAVFATGTDSYPKSYTAANGSSATAGFTQGSRNQRDRSAAIDARLAGIVFVANNTATLGIFRVDLPATGTYTISLASGDQSSPQPNDTVSLADNGTVFATIVSNGSPTSGQFYDASGTLRTSAANWVSGQATITHTFTSTVATVIVGCNCGATTSSVITHIRFTASGGGGGPTAGGSSMTLMGCCQ